MAGYVRNAQRLLAHGDSKLRAVALDIVEHALAATDPYPVAKRLLECDGRRLRVGNDEIALGAQTRVLFIGAGKASWGIARAVEEALGDRLADGLVVCKYGQQGTLRRIRMLLASHPVPDEAGVAAAAAAMNLARTARAGDVVICGITGGSSALLPMPVSGLSLADKQEMTRLLLTCGANIVEINAVRKHLSRIKGGQLAAAIAPGVQLINLTVSDVIGDGLDCITDPTVADTSTLGDAQTTLDKYRLWEQAPSAVAHYLRGTQARETPKDLACSISNHILASGDGLCTAAAQRARALGYSPLLLSTRFEGESREVGRAFAAMAREALASARPLAAPCALIGGGETVVHIDAWQGAGGPNQEFALAAALELDGCARTLAVGLDSDGTDGPTEFAGGLVDHSSAGRARALGVDLFDVLRQHDTASALERLDDAIVTGATGTNVNDLKLVLVASR